MMAKQETTSKQEVQASNGAERTRSTRVYAPNVDIFSEGDTIVLLADMPGVDEKSIDITLEKNVLTVQGFVTPREHSGYELGYAEYGEGDYYRSFTVPDEIDRDHIEATVRNGVLRLQLPKSPQAKTKRITVQAA